MARKKTQTLAVLPGDLLHGLESETEERLDKDQAQRIREELARLYKTRADDTHKQIDNLKRTRTLIDALMLYANPDAWVYRIPLPHAYAKQVLIELGLLLPDKKQVALPTIERGHKGVPDIPSDAEISGEDHA